MTNSRKFVIALCVAVVGYGGFLAYEEHEVASLASAVERALLVGDSTEKVESVMKERGLDARYDAKEHYYAAVVRVPHQNRDILILMHLDAEKKVAKVEIKRRMWI